MEKVCVYVCVCVCVCVCVRERERERERYKEKKGNSGHFNDFTEERMAETRRRKVDKDRKSGSIK